jgi:hypothetical protein
MVKCTNVFFILAMGRSGSMFMANLLNQVPEAQVCHEPMIADFPAYTQAFYSEEVAEDYLRRFRQKDICLRMRPNEYEVYGEVNTNLRRHCKALKHFFPNVILLHLVRDGRDVVRSMRSRRTFRAWDPVTVLIHPLQESQWREVWTQMDRFEKLCWYWATENRYLRHNIDRTVQFEKILSNYDYFARQVLAPLGLTLSRDTWLSMKQRPKNATRRYSIPHWSDWDVAKRRAFGKICGGEMRANGYELKW